MIRDVLGSLWRRWYIVFPGLLLAGVLATGAWLVIPPSYERSASQFLVPATGSLSESSNPYLYLSGLTVAADVIVRAVGSENVVQEIQESYRGVEIEVLRDPSTAGPVILTIVNAQTDEDAAEVLDILLERTQTELQNLQLSDKVRPSDQITVQPITIDQHGTVRQRTRLVTAVGAGGVAAMFAIVMAAVVDGLSSRRRHRRG